MGGNRRRPDAHDTFALLKGRPDSAPPPNRARIPTPEPSESRPRCAASSGLKMYVGDVSAIPLFERRAGLSQAGGSLAEGPASHGRVEVLAKETLTHAVQTTSEALRWGG